MSEVPVRDFRRLYVEPGLVYSLELSEEEDFFKAIGVPMPHPRARRA